MEALKKKNWLTLRYLGTSPLHHTLNSQKPLIFCPCSWQLSWLAGFEGATAVADGCEVISELFKAMQKPGCLSLEGEWQAGACLHTHLHLHTNIPAPHGDHGRGRDSLSVTHQLFCAALPHTLCQLSGAVGSICTC